MTKPAWNYYRIEFSLGDPFHPLFNSLNASSSDAAAQSLPPTYVWLYSPSANANRFTRLSKSRMWFSTKAICTEDLSLVRAAYASVCR